MSDTLAPGRTLRVDRPLESTGGFAKLVFQDDENLVLYGQRGGDWSPRWATNTAGVPIDKCALRTNGNLVLVRGTKIVWSSGTEGHPGARLVVQQDENVVIYDGAQPVWATHTSLDGTPIKGDGPKVYHLFDGVRHWIPDPETLEQMFGGWGRVSQLSEAQVEQWPEGDPVPSVRPPVITSVDEVHACLDQTASGPPHPPREVPISPPRIEADGSVGLGTITQPLAGVTELMWNAGQTVRVKMMGGTDHVRSKVRQYAEEWMRYANIRFQFVDPSQYAEIKVAFDQGGSWSYLGRDALWIPFEFATMNYGWLTDNSPEQEFSRVVLHEFGHALGLIHEHQSPVSGIQWDKEKAYAFYKERQGWDRGQVDAQVFDKYRVGTTNYSQYDPTSIMHYWIPASLTLDGKGAPGSSSLSATDKSYVAMWYAQAVTPQNSVGLLRTGDDCDEIEFTVQYGAVGLTSVAFRLQPGSTITWWKAIEVPVGGGGYRMLEMQDGGSAEQTIPRSDLDTSRPIRFHKAKEFGAHRRLGFTWDVLNALPGGSMVTLVWRRDRC